MISFHPTPARLAPLLKQFHVRGCEVDHVAHDLRPRAAFAAQRDQRQDLISEQEDRRTTAAGSLSRMLVSVWCHVLILTESAAFVNTE
jgi:hypothetical protein